MRIRPFIQGFFLLVFIAALESALHPEASPFSARLFAYMDPLLTWGTAIAARMVVAGFLVSLIVAASVFLAGRMFCGYICPMGTTIDMVDSARKHAGKKKADHHPQDRVSKGWKYSFLVLILVAGLFGISLVHLGSPLSLITRGYGMIAEPLAVLLGDLGLKAIRPASEYLHLDGLRFFSFSTRQFEGRMALILFFGSLVVLAGFFPRFWCRHICPAGAIFALCSAKPLVRRQVSQDCIRCGKCARKCPMNAILEEEPEKTDHMECIVCQTCVQICPVSAVSFHIRGSASQTGSHVNLARRQLLVAGLSGAASAGLVYTGLYSLYGKPGPGQMQGEGIIRPPASLPEEEFLRRCVRCGACMAVCPTNTLQPGGFARGINGWFAPVITPRRGYCDPGCHACAGACPTSAISLISQRERIWAKTGSAVVDKNRCIAWEQGKACMVCDEVCPYKAVEFVRVPGVSVPVPRVDEAKCAGCGYCEHYCPVQNKAAIRVHPIGSLHLASGSYEAEGKALGLSLSLRKKTETGYPEALPEKKTGLYKNYTGKKEKEGLPPGFDPAGEEKDTLPPGFDPLP